MDRRKRKSAHASLFGPTEFIRAFHCSVIVAHPGDEIIGAGGLISRLRDVTVLRVTDGAPEIQAIQRTGFARTSDLSRTRKAKCAAALAFANVSADRIVDFGVQDLQTPHILAVLARRIAAFMQESEADIVLTHPFEGGHPDHDTTAFAINSAVRFLKRNGFEPPVLFEIALHPSKDGKKRVLDFLPGSWREITTLVLNEETRDLKRRMLDCFASQEETLRGIPLGLEKFRTPPNYDFSVAPNSGEPAYENFHSGMIGVQWQALARKALSELFPTDRSGRRRASGSLLNGSPAYG